MLHVVGNRWWWAAAADSGAWWWRRDKASGGTRRTGVRPLLLLIVAGCCCIGDDCSTPRSLARPTNDPAKPAAEIRTQVSAAAVHQAVSSAAVVVVVAGNVVSAAPVFDMIDFGRDLILLHSFALVRHTRPFLQFWDRGWGWQPCGFQILGICELRFIRIRRRIVKNFGQSIMETDFREEPTGAKRRKREDGTEIDEDYAFASAASDCYQDRCSRQQQNSSFVDVVVSPAPAPAAAGAPVAESWLTDLEPFVMMEDSLMMDDDPMAGQEESRQDHLLQLRRQLIQTKYRLEKYTDRDFRTARRYCNPYEALDNNDTFNLFLNRSALKLANMDALLDFRLSSQLKPAYYFVDLCGAPGGFGEYLVWRGATRGYGMSLVGRNENGRGLYWNRELVQLQQQQQPPNQKKSQHHQHQHPVCYEIHNGIDGTGDVYNWENIISLQRRIQQQSSLLQPPGDNDDDTGGAQLVLADGGVDAQRNVDHQEQVTIKLLVCQIAAGLYLLRHRGTLVFKAFGFQTTVMRAMMSYIGRNFATVTVLKPITSRPASAERYVVAEGYKGTTRIDGPRWISQMLLARPVDIIPQICAFLDSKDEAMLTLNLKACGDILSHMHRMETRRDHEIMEEEEEEDESSLSIFSFNAKWQLF
jgi:cap1 methyltransferase